MESVEQQVVIRGWRLTAAREAVGIDSVKKLAAHLAVYAEARSPGQPKPRGFSAPHLNDIERGKQTLSPLAADYIADALGMPRSFFTCPVERLGDMALQVVDIATPAVPTPLVQLTTSASEDLLSAAAPALDLLDDLLDRRADGEPPRLPDSDEDDQPQTGTGR